MLIPHTLPKVEFVLDVTIFFPLLIAAVISSVFDESETRKIDFHINRADTGPEVKIYPYERSCLCKL